MNRFHTRFKWMSVPLAALSLALSVGPAVAQDASAYLSHDGLADALRELSGRFPSLARLSEIGKSGEGRSVWVMEVANPDGAPVAERPALFVAANFEGNQIFGSGLVLDEIERLLEAYPSNEQVKKILDTSVLYFLPRANPDGAEAMFAPVKSGTRANQRPFDDDNDGRVDEDGPEDLNGDGLISVMRVREAGGPYMIHPDDSRLMKKADPAKGEAGEFQIYWEGVDSDGDGFLNEDPPGGVDINRNFQHQYPYYQPEAGAHMVSEPETRAILDWMLEHRNIGIILTYGESDNLTVPPDSKGKLGPESRIDLTGFAADSLAESRTVGIFEIESRGRSRFFGGYRGDDGSQRTPDRPRRPPRRPEVDVNGSDLPYFKAVSDEFRKITGIETTPAVRTPAGAFFEYGYFQYGVLSLSTPGWGLSEPSAEAGDSSRTDSASEEKGSPAGENRGRPSGGPASRPGTGTREGGAKAGGSAEYDAKLLKWMDRNGIDGFVPWQEYEHPEKGTVEIGGFRPYAGSNPPANWIEPLGEKQFQFVCYLASLFPRVSIAESSVDELGGGLYRVRAEVQNTGFLPTSLAHGVVSESVKPTMVQLGVEPSMLVSGDAKTSFIKDLAGSGRRRKYEWIIRGEAGTEITLRVVSQKGGAAIQTLSLQ